MSSSSGSTGNRPGRNSLRFSIGRKSFDRDSDSTSGTSSSSKWHSSGTTAVELAFIVADFLGHLSSVQRRYSEDVGKLVQKFQERTQPFTERCPERCGCIQSAWSGFLKNFSTTAEETLELSDVMGDHGISSQLGDIAKYRRELLSEVTTHHNTFIGQLERKEKQLQQVQADYHNSWLKMNAEGVDLQNPSTVKCYNLLNEYVLQLTATNHNETTICDAALNRTISDLEAIQCDIQEAIAFSLNRFARMFQTELLEQTSRLDDLITSTQKANHLQATQDLSVLTNISRPVAKTFGFTMVADEQGQEFNSNELVVNKATEPTLKQKYMQLTQQVRDLEAMVAASRESLTHHRKQLESQKASEKAALVAKTLAEIHTIKNDIRCQELSLGIHRQQNATNGHSQPSTHSLQDYNFIKTTLCFQCKTPLKGLMKQGLRCKVCKVSVHHKCQDNLPECNVLAQEKAARTSSKKIFHRQNSVQDIRVSLADKRKFLRRQKSSSALEVPEDTLREKEEERASRNVDPVYETIRNAASLSISETRPPTRLSTRKDEDDTFLLTPDPASLSRSAPHSPIHTSDDRRKMLSNCGKSVSLDNEQGAKENERRQIVPSLVLAPENSKPRSSTHKFVVLYDFEGMLRDDLTIRAGEIIRVLSGLNSEWWKGEVDGRVGYFPSFCVTPIYDDESIMEVTSTVRASHEHIDGINLRKHQIVIMMSGSEDNGWVKGVLNSHSVENFMREYLFNVSNALTSESDWVNIWIIDWI